MSDTFADDDFDRGNPLAAIIAEADPQGPLNSYREAAMAGHKFIRTAFYAIKSYAGSKHFALDCFLLAMGETDIVGVDSQEDLAQRWHCEKANVGKVVKKFQTLLNLPPASGQRRLNGCEKMRERRKKQLRNIEHSTEVKT